MQFLTKGDILSVEDMPKEIVDVPEWGGAVYVRSMSASERDTFEQSVSLGSNGSVTRNLNNIRARLAVLCLCDESGNRMFEDAEAETLGRKSAAALDRIFEVARRLNALTDSDVEELRKNLPAVPSVDST